MTGLCVSLLGDTAPVASNKMESYLIIIFTVTISDTKYFIYQLMHNRVAFKEY